MSIVNHDDILRCDVVQSSSPNCFSGSSFVGRERFEFKSNDKDNEVEYT
jgi:hypothetical protein